MIIFVSQEYFVVSFAYPEQIFCLNRLEPQKLAVVAMALLYNQDEDLFQSVTDGYCHFYK